MIYSPLFSPAALICHAANIANINIPKWTPYQLRHTAVTETSYQYGIDAARAMAGHTTINTTAIYEHTAERLKTDLASKRAAYFDSSD